MMPVRMPELQFLNLAQIDKDIQLNRALEAKNALAPFVRRQAEIDMEKGELEMQLYRDKLAQQQRIRTGLSQLYQPHAGGELPTIAQERPTSYAGPDNPMSPRVAGPDWMQGHGASQPASTASPRLPNRGNEDTRSIRLDMLTKQAQIYEQNGDYETAGKIYDHYFKLTPKVKDWQKVEVDGEVRFAPYFEDGTAGAPVPYKVAEKLHFANIGPETVGQNQFTGAVVSRVKNGRSPDSLASEATQRYIHNTPSATAQLNAQQGKIPPGYRVSADGTSLEPIPGGPAVQGKALPGPAIKELGGAGASYENTQRLQNTFKDDFGGKVILGDMSNTMGRIFGDETGQAQWWQDMEMQQNQTRHELFGSALTKTELAAWEKTAVTPNMDAKQIRQNLSRRSEIEARAASKLARAYQAAGYNKDQIREVLGNAAQYLDNPAPPAGTGKGAPAGDGRAPASAAGPVAMKTMPNPAQYKGYTVTDQSTGVRYQSNGSNWVRVKQ